MVYCSVEELYEKYVTCGFRVGTDTRNIEKGSIFFCLKGANFNGNTFAAEALAKGASYVVADEPQAMVSDRVLAVENVLKALQDLAKWHRNKIKTHILAIGGSNGKTTTKELCVAVASPVLKTRATKGNLNNHIGVPLTLLELNGSEDLAIVELGTNHPGEMEFLCELVNPDSGIVTNIGKEHLEGFGDLEGVAKEESALFLKLMQNGGKALVNVDDPWLSAMKTKLTHTLAYGIENPAILQGEIIENMPRLQFGFQYNGQSFGPFTAELGGKYNLYNILSAIGVGLMLGLDPKLCAENACAYKPSNNRSEWLNKGSKKILLDAYNANPSSMEAALHEFSRLPGTRAVCLGDMLEMGGSAAKEHRAILDLCKTLGFEEVYLCGAIFREISDGFPDVYDSADELKLWLQRHPTRADYVLIKGSRGIKMESILEAF